MVDGLPVQPHVRMLPPTTSAGGLLGSLGGGISSMAEAGSKPVITEHGGSDFVGREIAQEGDSTGGGDASGGGREEEVAAACSAAWEAAWRAQAAG